MNDGYKVLLIDLDGTVVDYDATEAAALRDVHRGLYADRIGLAEFIAGFSACNERLWQGYRRGEGDLDELRVERFAQLGLAVPPAQAAALYERYLGLRATLFADARSALGLLGDRFRLVLVTDGIAEVQHAKLWQTRLAGIFEKVVISAEAGFRKPRPELLWHALSAAGVPAADALVVGDSQASDGVGARAAGIDFCWVRRGSRGRRDDSDDSDYKVPTRFEVRDLSVLAHVLLRQPVPSVPPTPGEAPCFSGGRRRRSSR